MTRFLVKAFFIVVTHVLGFGLATFALRIGLDAIGIQASYINAFSMTAFGYMAGSVLQGMKEISDIIARSK